MFFDLDVYVACALTNAPEESRQKVYRFQDALAKICRVLRFLGLTEHTGRETYNYDINGCVQKADLVVGVVDVGSSGLGWELCYQCVVKKGPAIALAHVDNLSVTRFLWDPDVADYKLLRYKDLCTDGVEAVAEKLKKIQEAKDRQLVQMDRVRSKQPSQLSLFEEPGLQLVGSGVALHLAATPAQAAA